MAAQRKKIATCVAIATNKTMEMRLNRSGNVTFAPGVFVNIAKELDDHCCSMDWAADSNLLTYPSWQLTSRLRRILWLQKPKEAIPDSHSG